VDKREKLFGVSNDISVFLKRSTTFSQDNTTTGFPLSENGLSGSKRQKIEIGDCNICEQMKFGGGSE